MSWGVVLDAMKAIGTTAPPVGTAAALHTEVLLHPNLPHDHRLYQVLLKNLPSVDADDGVGANNHLQLRMEGLPWGHRLASIL